VPGWLFKMKFKCDDLLYDMTYHSKSRELPVVVFVSEVMVVGGRVGDTDCGNAGEHDRACWHRN
jgi:hypothetical protein